MKLAQKKSVAVAWNDLVRNTRNLEETLLELVRHPDATDEQILQAAHLYRDAYARVVRNWSKVDCEVGGAYPLSQLKRRTP